MKSLFSYLVAGNRPVYLLSTLFLGIAACLSVGFLHPDEHFQLLEFANYKLGGIPGNELPWEFGEQMRPAFQVIPVYLLARVMIFFGVFDPFVLAFLLRLITGLLSFWALYNFFRAFRSEIHTPAGKWMFAALLFLLWYVPFLAVRYSSEAWGTLFFLAGLSLYIRLIHQQRKSFFLFLGAGTLLGVSFVCRYQMGFMIGGLFAWILFLDKSEWRLKASALAGLIFLLGVGFLSDWWFYGTPVSTAYHYFYQNLVEDKASGFGVSPVWEYAIQTPVFVFPLAGIVVIPCLIYFFIKYRKHPVTWILLPFLLVHHVIGHKELRFLFPVAPFLPFVVVTCFHTWKKKRIWIWLAYPFWTLNFFALLVRSTMPADDLNGMYRFLYDKKPQAAVYYYNNKNATLYFQWNDIDPPVQRVVRFYFSGENTFRAFSSVEELERATFTDSANTVLVVRKTDFENKFRTENYQILYQTWHSVLQPLNYGNWLDSESVGWMLVVEPVR